MKILGVRFYLKNNPHRSFIFDSLSEEPMNALT